MRIGAVFQDGDLFRIEGAQRRQRIGGVDFLEHGDRRPPHLGDPNRLVADAVTLHQLPRQVDLVHKTVLGSDRSQAVAVGVDIHHVERLARSGDETLLDELIGDPRGAAVDDLKIRINLMNDAARLDQEFGVLLGVRFKEPELLQVRLVPDLPIADSILIARHGRSNKFSPGVEVFDHRTAPRGVVIENREHRQAVLIHLVQSRVDPREVPCPLRIFDDRPDKVGSNEADPRLADRLKDFIEARIPEGDVGADPEGGVLAFYDGSVRGIVGARRQAAEDQGDQRREQKQEDRTEGHRGPFFTGERGGTDRNGLDTKKECTTGGGEFQRVTGPGARPRFFPEAIARLSSSKKPRISSPRRAP